MTTKQAVVFGATGNTGGATVDALLASPQFARGNLQVTALVRDSSSEKAVALQDKGVVLEVGSYDDTNKLQQVLKTADCCFLSCSNCLEQVELETNVIDAAENSDKCLYLVKVSTCQATVPDTQPYISDDSVIQYGQYHAAIEDRLQRCTKLKYTSLRPNYFMQNFIGDIFVTLPQNKMIAYPHQNNYKATVIDVRDIGTIAAKLLLLENDRTKFENKFLNVCGPKSWSMEDIAKEYAKALDGAPIQLVRCSKDDYVNGLVQGAGFPDWLATSVGKTHTVFWDYGGLDYESSDEILDLMSDSKWRGMEDWINEMAPMVQFSSSQEE